MNPTSADQDVPMHDQSEEIDLLITRIVDAAAGDRDWAAFRALAATDESLWQRLAEAQAQQQQLARALTPALEAADATPLPVVVREEAPGPRGVIRWPAWAGWAVAALVALMWWTGGGWTPTTHTADPSPRGQQAGLGPTLANFSQVETTPSDLLANYLQSEHVVGQGELQPIDTMETPHGTDVLIMRPIYERVRLEPKYQRALDEKGEVVPLRVPRSPVDLVDYAL